MRIAVLVTVFAVLCVQVVFTDVYAGCPGSCFEGMEGGNTPVGGDPASDNYHDEITCGNQKCYEYYWAPGAELPNECYPVGGLPCRKREYVFVTLNRYEPKCEENECVPDTGTTADPEDYWYWRCTTTATCN